VGTNINVNEIQQKFRSFILNFQNLEDEQKMFDEKNYYVRELKNIIETEIYVINLNCDHVYRYDKQL